MHCHKVIVGLERHFLSVQKLAFRSVRLSLRARCASAHVHHTTIHGSLGRLQNAVSLEHLWHGQCIE